MRWKVAMVLVWRWRLRHTRREGDRKSGWNGTAGKHFSRSCLVCVLHLPAAKEVVLLVNHNHVVSLRRSVNAAGSQALYDESHSTQSVLNFGVTKVRKRRNRHCLE
jgi:hypothetical protein